MTQIGCIGCFVLLPDVFLQSLQVLVFLIVPMRSLMLLMLLPQ
jgi:hypothetical protein